jgi:hypothetical protein
VKNALKPAARAAAEMLPAAVLARLGMPALAALVFLAVLVLGVICWVISSPHCSERVARLMLARRGNDRCLGADLPARSPLASADRWTSGLTRPGESLRYQR